MTVNHRKVTYPFKGHRISTLQLDNILFIHIKALTKLRAAGLGAHNSEWVITSKLGYTLSHTVTVACIFNDFGHGRIPIRRNSLNNQVIKQDKALCRRVAELFVTVCVRFIQY